MSGKFKVGDRVRVTYHFSAFPEFNGAVGTIVGKTGTDKTEMVYFVETNVVGGPNLPDGILLLNTSSFERIYNGLERAVEKCSK